MKIVLSYDKQFVYVTFEKRVENPFKILSGTNILELFPEHRLIFSNRIPKGKRYMKLNETTFIPCQSFEEAVSYVRPNIRFGKPLSELLKDAMSK